MSVFHCKMCGGNLEVTEGMKICKCGYCDSFQTIPDISSKRKEQLFQKAHDFRFRCEFDKAEMIYDTICTDFPEEPEAYWGKLLCRYGIEYVDDPQTGRKIPTCHRASFKSILDDADFRSVMEYSDNQLRNIYRQEAENIDCIRENILSIAAKEKPFDVFICYKESDSDEQRTEDSRIAQQLYDELTDKGLKVFFARQTLRDKLGVRYEPYIFSAINTSMIMIGIGTCPEYFDAVWVRNEWSRFISFTERDKDRLFIPCYKNMSITQLPEQFRGFQAQDLNEPDAVGKIVSVAVDYNNAKKKSKAELHSLFDSYETQLINERSRLATLDKEVMKRCIQDKAEAKKKYNQARFKDSSFFIIWFILGVISLPWMLEVSDSRSTMFIIWTIFWIIPPAIATPMRYIKNLKAYRIFHEAMCFDEDAGSYEQATSKKSKIKYEALNALKTYNAEKFPTAMMTVCSAVSGTILGSALSAELSSVMALLLSVISTVGVPLILFSPLIITMNRRARKKRIDSLEALDSDTDLGYTMAEKIYRTEHIKLLPLCTVCFILAMVIAFFAGIVTIEVMSMNISASEVIVISLMLVYGACLPYSIARNIKASKCFQNRINGVSNENIGNY